MEALNLKCGAELDGLKATLKTGKGHPVHVIDAILE